MNLYMRSAHSVEGDAPPSPEAMARMFADVDAFNGRLQEQGAWVFAGGLQPASTATVMRIRAGAAVSAAGPFLKGRAHLGGFWVIEATNLDAALAWAGEAALACQSPVEVRPFQEEAED